MNLQINNLPVTMINGEKTIFGAIRKPITLVVNTATKCGLAPQFAALESLQKDYGNDGIFTVVAFPSNQFLQERGSEKAIAEACSLSWGTSFPMTAKVSVNGKDRDPIFDALISAAKLTGKSGRIKWNFEKFLILDTDEVLRFGSLDTPNNPILVTAIKNARKRVLNGGKGFGSL